ncbi:hypothetical protein [Corallococcus macrosporus]|uniref:hypothetical protein n=1 Tax=Corallococcus macrosporus TaxID=35 RepID=UPI0012FE5939|nr:hypothetical protein [Corallococcus macrosporus]
MTEEEEQTASELLILAVILAIPTGGISLLLWLGAFLIDFFSSQDAAKPAPTVPKQKHTKKSMAYFFKTIFWSFAAAIVITIGLAAINAVPGGDASGLIVAGLLWIIISIATFKLNNSTKEPERLQAEQEIKTKIAALEKELQALKAKSSKGQ